MADAQSQIKVRLPDGKVFECTVGTNDPLRCLKMIIATHLNDNDFVITTNYPRKIFVEEEFDDLTPAKAGLSPKGMVIVQKSISFDLKEATTPLLTKQVIHIKGQADFDKYSKMKNVLVIADFSAEWCGPCKMIAPAFERLCKQHGEKAVFLHIDVDQNRDLNEGKDVEAVPTFKFFKNGQLLNQFSSADEQKLSYTIQSLL